MNNSKQLFASIILFKDMMQFRYLFQMREVIFWKRKLTNSPDDSPACFLGWNEHCQKYVSLPGAVLAVSATINKLDGDSLDVG
jgi:hypothetical protein